MVVVSVVRRVVMRAVETVMARLAAGDELKRSVKVVVTVGRARRW